MCRLLGCGSSSSSERVDVVGGVRMDCPRGAHLVEAPDGPDRPSARLNGSMAVRPET